MTSYFTYNIQLILTWTTLQHPDKRYYKITYAQYIWCFSPDHRWVVLIGTTCTCQIDGLVQERRNSSALASKLRLSCTNPSKWFE